MGVQEIHLWDDDVLETRNGPVEIAYSEAYVGQLKIDAARATVDFLVGEGAVKLITHNERVTKDTALEGVVISGVDSMASRAEIWECVKDNFLGIPLYVDARSSGEEIMVFGFSPADFAAAEEYTEDWMYSDSEASKLECGARNIGYIAAMIGGEIARIVTRFHRDLPIEFRTARDLSNN